MQDAFMANYAFYALMVYIFQMTLVVSLFVYSTNYMLELLTECIKSTETTIIY